MIIVCDDCAEVHGSLPDLHQLHEREDPETDCCQQSIRLQAHLQPQGYYNKNIKIIFYNCGVKKLVVFKHILRLQGEHTDSNTFLFFVDYFLLWLEKTVNLQAQLLASRFSYNF